MTGREWFLVGWYAIWVCILIGGICYTIKEAKRHKRHKRTDKGSIKRVPLTERWWKLKVGKENG